MSASEKLRQLDEQATPARWVLGDGWDECHPHWLNEAIMDSSADAQLSATLRNCLPEICALIEAVQHAEILNSEGACKVALAALDTKLGGQS